MISRSVAATLKRATKVLESLGLTYAIVGGLAVSAWAGPRATRDADLWVHLEGKEDELDAALSQAGFDVPALREELRHFGVFRAKDEQSGVFVDMFNAVGPLGDAILASRTRGSLGDLDVWLAGANEVAILKAYSDRPRDFDDLVRLLEHGGVDANELMGWARKLDASIGTDEVTARVRLAMETVRR